MWRVIMDEDLQKWTERARKISKFFHDLVLLATLASSLTVVSPLCADTVWVSKDCSVTPCAFTFGNSTTGTPLAAGRFRKIGSSAFWSATYLGTPNRFWVSVGGMNMADQQVSTSAG